MISQRFAKLVLASSIALALAACSTNYDDYSKGQPSPVQDAPVVAIGDVVVLTASNKLMTFNRNAPATQRTSVTVTGLQSGEYLVGIDYRPKDNLLYAVGSAGRVYTVDLLSGAATLKSTLIADPTDTTAPYTALSGAEFGVDFNPVPDRLRVVSNTGQNLRINVDTGATTTDGAINGGPASASVTAAAYTNSFAGAGNTTLFVIDAANSTQYTQNPPNNGTLSVPVVLGIGNPGGFDIDARTNIGYGVFQNGAVRNFYSINLSATATPGTLIGALSTTEDIRGLALRSAASAVVYGLTDDNRLVSFKAATPNTLDSNVAISGLTGGETIIGIDVRPKDGLLYAMTSMGRILTLDAATGVSTVKATVFADIADTTSPYMSLAGTSYAVDFNPLADRLRVISNAGQNLRINVDTGATTTDGAINQTGATPRISAAAYTNNFAGTTTTMLFDIDTVADTLELQSPPNDGTLTRIGALGVDVSGDIGFDIGGGANGLALAAMRTSVSGASSLYRVDLATATATLLNGVATPALSVVGTGIGLRDIAISIQ